MVAACLCRSYFFILSFLNRKNIAKLWLEFESRGWFVVSGFMWDLHIFIHRISATWEIDTDRQHFTDLPTDRPLKRESHLAILETFFWEGYKHGAERQKLLGSGVVWVAFVAFTKVVSSCFLWVTVVLKYFEVGVPGLYLLISKLDILYGLILDRSNTLHCMR